MFFSNSLFSSSPILKYLNAFTHLYFIWFCICIAFFTFTCDFCNGLLYTYLTFSNETLRRITWISTLLFM